MVDPRLAPLVCDLECTEGATEDVIAEVQEKLGTVLPHEYLEFMRYSNGAEGPIGRTGYLSLWPLEELVTRNRGLEAHKYVPGLILFGSDGGSEAYGFTVSASPRRFVSIPFIPLDIEEARECGTTFVEFLEKVAVS